MSRRRSATTPEMRAELLNDPDYMASGTSYISVEMRETNKYGKVPYYRNAGRCTHQVSMCPTWDCIESWSVDYKVNLHLTGGGRDLAKRLGIDPAKFAEARRNGIERLHLADFMIKEN